MLNSGLPPSPLRNFPYDNVLMVQKDVPLNLLQFVSKAPDQVNSSNFPSPVFLSEDGRKPEMDTSFKGDT